MEHHQQDYRTKVSARRKVKSMHQPHDPRRWTSTLDRNHHDHDHHRRFHPDRDNNDDPKMDFDEDAADDRYFPINSSSKSHDDSDYDYYDDEGMSLSAKMCNACSVNRIREQIPTLPGREKMKWARRAFFMSTEKIFPGFTKRSELQQASTGIREATGIKLRTSVPLKMCLLAHAYFIPVWSLGFLLTQEYATASLKPLHSYVHSSLTYVSIATDVCRLYAGIVSNTKDDMQMLALYWMATVVLQTPIMSFIFATHTFSKYRLPFNVSLDVVLGIILIMEILVGFWHLKGLIGSEIQLLYLARQMNETMALREHRMKGKLRTVNCPHSGPHVQWSEDEQEISSDEENQGGGNGDGRRRKSRKARRRKTSASRYRRMHPLQASASFKTRNKRSNDRA